MRAKRRAKIIVEVERAGRAPEGLADAGALDTTPLNAGLEVHQGRTPSRAYAWCCFATILRINLVLLLNRLALYIQLCTLSSLV